MTPFDMSNKPLPLLESIAAVFGMAVVALLAALPSVGTAADESAERVLKDHLRQVRTAMHALIESGENVPTTATELEAVLLEKYLTAIPVNPINGQDSIRVNSVSFFEPKPNGTAGWLFVPGDQRVVPDLPTRDRNGTPFLSY